MCARIHVDALACSCVGIVHCNRVCDRVCECVFILIDSYLPHLALELADRVWTSSKNL